MSVWTDEIQLGQAKTVAEFMNIFCKNLAWGDRNADKESTLSLFSKLVTDTMIPIQEKKEVPVAEGEPAVSENFAHPKAIPNMVYFITIGWPNSRKEKEGHLVSNADGTWTIMMPVTKIGEGMPDEEDFMPLVCWNFPKVHQLVRLGDAVVCKIKEISAVHFKDEEVSESVYTHVAGHNTTLRS